VVPPISSISMLSMSSISADAFPSVLDLPIGPSVSTHPSSKSLSFDSSP